MTAPYQDFPPALLTLSPRLTLAGDPGSSLVGINTTPIADGAWCYCVANKSEYQLDKADSTTAADGSTVLAPLAGPGRWFKRLPAISTTVVWRPDGLGDVTTFDQVYGDRRSEQGSDHDRLPADRPASGLRHRPWTAARSAGRLRHEGLAVRRAPRPA
jgi:hypothetical protein